MVSVVYGNNGDGYIAKERVEWMVCYIICYTRIFLRRCYLQYTII